MAVRSESSEAVRKLHALFEEGGGQGLWESGNISACARAIGVNRRDFSRLLQGKRPDDNVLPVLETLRQYVQERAIAGGQSRGETPMEEFEQYYQKGLQLGRWNDMETCAEAMGVAAQTVSKYRKTPVKELCRTGHGKTSYELMIRKIRSMSKNSRTARMPLGELTGKSEAPAVTHEYPSEGSTPLPTTDLPTLLSQPALQRIDALEAKITALFESTLPSENAFSPPAGVVPSSWVDDVVAGRLDIEGQRLPNVRFILTKEVTHRLLTSLGQKEVEDTQEYAEMLANAVAELRRRLTVSAQQEDQDDHARFIRSLVPSLTRVIRELVALAITTESLRECDLENGLIRAAMHFDSLSGIFSGHPHERG